MKVLDSASILRELGYSFISRSEPAEKPETAEKRFEDVVPQLSSSKLAGKSLYKHQERALLALEKGKNVILCSGTGSGKTEAWALFFLEKGVKTIAIYPTLALANDQIQRIEEYCSLTGKRALLLDARKKKELGKKAKGLVVSADIIITNPAFLFHDLKKLILKGTSLLAPVFRDLELLVIDEFDFYGPRSIALLLGTIKFITEYSEKPPQIVVLTATLANPEELADFLEKVTRRKTEIIHGKPFRVENRTYIVLGKELEKIWKKLRTLPAEDKEIEEILTDFERFKEECYKVVEYFRAKGFSVPSPILDITEILKQYVRDEGVTLVFTRSISKAEELARKLREELGDVAFAHHHLVPKELREKIEEKARRGEVKILVSPKTLTQGIDIGTVVRVVHMGLPEDVREFRQREGRKGRREEIPFTETIIFPGSRWDRELLSQGFGALDAWLSLPPEKAIVNPKNKYLFLFTGIAKLISPWLPKEFTKEEEQALKEAKILVNGEVREGRLKWVWERLGFYEFAPPYGIKRYLEGEPLKPIGHCDLVERFQIGCIDLSADAIVVSHRLSGRKRVVTAVEEKRLRNIMFSEHPALAEAVEDYYYQKKTMGEVPKILSDIFSGRLSSGVLCVVYPPKRGFGELVKIPNRVLWLLRSERPRIFKSGEKIIVARERRLIYVSSPTFGEYRDLTYGMEFEVSEGESATLLRLGLALLTIILRRKLGIPFETIKYGVGKVGEKKFIEIHEPEAAGLLEQLDWSELRKLVESYKPDDLDLVLLSLVDEIAYADFVSLNCEWSLAKEGALKVLDYLILREKMKLGEYEIPKPSKALKIVSLDLVRFEVPNRVKRAFLAISAFDGENTMTATGDAYRLTELKPPQEIRAVEDYVDDLVTYEDFKLVVTSREAIARECREAGLRKLPRILKDAISLEDLAKEKGIEPFSLELIAERLGLAIPGLDGLFLSLERAARRGKLGKTEEKLRDFCEERARAIYLAYLILSQQ